MNQLLPIVRRVRRPLVVADAPPVMVGSVEPVEAGVGNIEPRTSNAEPRTGEREGNLQMGNIEPPTGEKLVNEVAGGTPATTGETPVPPRTKNHAKTATQRAAR